MANETQDKDFWIIKLIVVILFFASFVNPLFSICLILFIFGAFYYRKNKEDVFPSWLLKNFITPSPVFYVILFLLIGLLIFIRMIGEGKIPIK